MHSSLDIKTKTLETLLSLYKEMVDLNLFTKKEVFEKVQNCIRDLFENPELSIGISVFFQKGDKKNELIRLVMMDRNKAPDVKHIYRDSIHYSNKHYEQSVYFTYMKDRYTIIEDFTKLTKSGIDYWLMRRGVRGMILLPLKNERGILGFLELTSTSTLSAQNINSEYLDYLLPVFTNSVSTFLLQLKDELHALIQKHFTAIHPTVEWMFEDLAIEWLKEEDIASIMSPIFLEKIYCLYGISDIRGSTDLRRRAIQKDLSTQVDLAKKIMNSCYQVRPFDYFQQLSFSLDNYLKLLSATIGVNDENSVLHFLREEVETLFDKIKDYSPQIAALCDEYVLSLSDVGAFYKNRKEFENSVHQLNLALNGLINDEQDRIQKFYPHFFEKHITDGIDHSMYVGSAMDFSKNFSPFHLKSLKIWQLKLLCMCAFLGEKVKTHLSLPLELAHLVVSQADPVTIYFDLQEKKFKVEGTYNIRFEIMKKRIDKAVIKNTQERLTQPGTIAVVYSVDSDKEEYLRYFDFLRDLGYIKSTYGDFVLEDMQGIQGLRALRVEIDLKTLGESVDMESILGKHYGIKK